MAIDMEFRSRHRRSHYRWSLPNGGSRVLRKLQAVLTTDSLAARLAAVGVLAGGVLLAASLATSLFIDL